MCGFAGEFRFAAGPADLDVVRAMAETLSHRGPDESGEWTTPDGRLALGFRRLSVLDPAGAHQPMSTPDDQAVLAFNGEIYNFRDLRDGSGRPPTGWRSQGDTEVLLYELVRGTHGALGKLEGMFAFAFYDGRTKELTLARDRLGQKPLWYAVLPDRIVFASEAKALRKHPGISGDISYSNLLDYLSLGYIAAPKSAWAAIRKLPPGHRLTVTPAGIGEAEPYWAPPAHRPAKPTGPAAVLDRLRYAVRSHLVSDVPLGVLLSGGIDSAVVALLASEAMGKDTPVRTFTAGFADAAYDERPLARLVADRIGAEHTELLIEPDPAGMLDWVVDQYDEPFADSSAIPTQMICQAARQYVTVALVGDGGDEVFSGYDRYRAMHLAQTMPKWKYAAARLAGAVANVVAPHRERSRLRRLARFAGALHLPPAMQYYRYRSLFAPEDLLTLLSDDVLADLDVHEPAEAFWARYEQGGYDSEADNARWHDVGHYLPGDLLVKADIASMSCSLELRAPLLDHKLVELALGLPTNDLLSGRTGKRLLREAFADRLPPEVQAAPKRGFGVPLARWLREDLRDELLATLTDRAVTDLGVFRPEAIAALANEHLLGRDHSHRLWSVLVLARWLVRNS